MKTIFKTFLCSLVPFLSAATGDSSAVADPSPVIVAVDEQKEEDILGTKEDSGFDSFKAASLKDLNPKPYAANQEGETPASDHETSKTIQDKDTSAKQPEDPGVLQLYAVRGQPMDQYYGNGAFFDTEETSPMRIRSHTVRGASRRGMASRKAKAEKDSEAGNGKTGKADGDNVILSNGCIQGDSTFVTENCQNATLPCCQKTDACLWDDDRISTVCPGACDGSRACKDLGSGSYIGKNACKGANACRSIAEISNKNKPATIAEDACVGRDACEDMCYLSTKCEVTIGKGSCNGERECESIGKYGYQVKSISIGTGACVSGDGNTRSCEYIGYYFGGDKIEILDYACLGDRACEEAVYYASSFTVGTGSCKGDEACRFLGKDTYKDVSVGENSCTDYKSCKDVGRQTAKKVTVKDNACTMSKSCYEFGEAVYDDDVKVEDYQCALADECSGRTNANCLITPKVPNNDGYCPQP